jgi:hypothetical protein
MSFQSEGYPEIVTILKLVVLAADSRVVKRKESCIIGIKIPAA